MRVYRTGQAPVVTDEAVLTLKKGAIAPKSEAPLVRPTPAQPAPKPAAPVHPNAQIAEAKRERELRAAAHQPAHSVTAKPEIRK